MLVQHIVLVMNRATFLCYLKKNKLKETTKGKKFLPFLHCSAIMSP